MPSTMTQPVRPRRSVLFMPGPNARALEKAKSLPADAVVFDLEDAVAPRATPWGRADLAGVATSGADAVLLPKVESPDAVGDAARPSPRS
jgi:citrate lyase subunit beta/citryl-CoA lyase